MIVKTVIGLYIALERMIKKGQREFAMSIKRMVLGQVYSDCSLLDVFSVSLDYYPFSMILSLISMKMLYAIL